MKVFAAAILLLSSAAAPQAKNGDPQVGTNPDGVPIRQASIISSTENHPAIRPAMDTYCRCLDQQLRHVLPATAEAVAAASLAACADVRTLAMREANALLKADTGWPRKRRRQSIESSFAQLDAVHREFLGYKIELHMASGEWRSPADLAVHGEPKTIDAESLTAEYRTCLAVRDGFVLESMLAPPPPDVRLGSDCTAYRNKAAAALDERFREAGLADDGSRRAIVEETVADIEALHVRIVTAARSKRKGR